MGKSVELVAVVCDVQETSLIPVIQLQLESHFSFY